MRAQPVSARCLRRAVAPLTTLCATAEGPASVTAVSVRRDTSVHNARYASAALTLARLNCKESKLLFNFYFQIIITDLHHHIAKGKPYLVINEQSCSSDDLTFNCCC